MSHTKTKVAILGATGAVGQKLVRLIDAHSDFEIAELAASERSAGKNYADACIWRESEPLGENIAQLTLKTYEKITTPLILSVLPSNEAKVIEPVLVQKGFSVISNASAYRMQKDVPLLIPEVNLDHLSLIEKQRAPGQLITNPNCLAVFAALALKPLSAIGAIEHISIVSLQAMSGAGYKGLSACEMMNNIIPNIAGEEAKIEQELLKILGTQDQRAPFSITVHTNRVPIMHGHSAILHVRFKEQISLPQVNDAFKKAKLQFPEAYQIHNDEFAPQPQRHMTDTDNKAHIGRIKLGDRGQVVGLTVMGHNLVRGAAGAALLNLEALMKYNQACV